MSAASGLQPAGVTPQNTGSIGFQGDIAAIPLDNIFQLFDLASLSGKLEVCSQENDGVFYFTGGVFIYGTLRVNPRRIGAILLENGLITPNQLKECLQLHEQSGQQQPLGRILANQGYVNPQFLDDSLERQIKEAFFEALAWQQGTFIYYPGEEPAPTAAQLHERVDHLLLEGMVYLDSLIAP
ncbi:MAG: DUF4388 domain-containing protein [Desulfobulbus sp.]|nr:DUF4388 domain-containing protein [Desulfobulbus sp.]